LLEFGFGEARQFETDINEVRTSNREEAVASNYGKIKILKQASPNCVV